MVYLAPTPLSPDSYRDNEKHVDNFADHLREKAAIEQKNITFVAADEVRRFKDVMFGVNTQYGGAQLRLRDDHGKVISKLKQGAQFKIVGEKGPAQTIDDDGNTGNPDEHIWVEVEVDAAQTEAGGNGTVRGWVSTEYINAMGQPAALDPVLDNPQSWGEDVPKPPKPNPEVVKPKTEETEKPGTLESPDAKYTEIPTAPVSQTPVNETEKPGNLQSPNASYTEVPTPPVSTTQIPETQKTEKPGALQSPDTKHTEAPTVNPQTTKPTNEDEKPGTVQFAPEETKTPTPEPEKKKGFFSTLNDTLNNYYTSIIRKVTGEKPIVSKPGTTTTNNGELVIKPANSDEKPVTTTPETVTTPEKPNTPPVVPTETAPEVEGTRHIIAEGDTIGKIADKYNIARKDLLKANNLTEGQPIYIGETLVIPQAVKETTTAVQTTPEKPEPEKKKIVTDPTE